MYLVSKYWIFTLKVFLDPNCKSFKSIFFSCHYVFHFCYVAFLGHFFLSNFHILCHLYYVGCDFFKKHSQTFNMYLCLVFAFFNNCIECLTQEIFTPTPANCCPSISLKQCFGQWQNIIYYHFKILSFSDSSI